MRFFFFPKNNQDIIKRTGVINLSTSPKNQKIASALTEHPSVLHGSQISDVQLTELASGKVLYAVGKDKVFFFFFFGVLKKLPVF